MSADPDPAQVDALRSFNRFYTRRIGVLEEGLLKTRFTLTQARVLFELGTRGKTTAVEIGAALGLDAGYLSRIVQDFFWQGLVTRKKSREDGRRVQLSLTPRGREAFRSLDGRSRAETGALLARVPSAGRVRLLAALREVRDLLSEPRDRSGEVVIRAHRLGDIGWAIERHAELYAEEYQWNEEFEALVAKLFARFACEHDPADERMWVAELDGKRAGCVFVVRNEEDPEAAQLRCLLVDRAARRHGIGRRLVAECVEFAQSRGYRRIMLWTNDVLVPARRIYEAAGFALVREERHHSFGHDLVGQFWVLEFQQE